MYVHLCKCTSKCSKIIVLFIHILLHMHKSEGEILRNYLRSKKITQQEVADIIGVSQVSYAMYENGSSYRN